jgi:poly(A) polymerase
VHLKTYHHAEHLIDRTSVDHHALAIVDLLQKSGHTAYVVGGSVRDLLLKLHPKDFDISTSAKPEEIKHLFQRQCLLIGRRFRLAHIRYGTKVFEVSTFRAGDPTASTLIIHDNRWGSEEEDVLRRDFTMNALFYDPSTETILDYVGGVEDIKRGLLRTIGDPDARFKQDPVRMIRLLKFQARFGFRCDDRALHAMDRVRHDILKSAPARILEEMFKMLESGKAEPFFRLLTDHGFVKLLFPCFHHFFDGPTRELASAYLHAIDEEQTRPGGHKLGRAILLAAIIFPILEEELLTLAADRQSALPLKEISHLTETLLHGISISSFVHFPRNLFANLFLIIVNQFRMTPLDGPPRLHARFHSHDDFLQSLDFLKLRVHVDPALGPLCDQWEEVSQKRSHTHSS